jgi:hypothetical protein
MRPRKEWRLHGTSPRDGIDQTTEHVYPEATLTTQPKWWRDLNVVEACYACNNYKGLLHPLDWLVIMPDHHGAKRLAELLVKLGEQAADILQSMRRRKL